MKKVTDNKFYSRAKESIEKYLLQRINILIILIFGIILYSNFKKNVDLNSLYYFQDFLIITIMIILSTVEDFLLLFITVFLGIIIYFAIRVTLVNSFYPQVLNCVSVTKNKFLRPIFLKLFFGKIIAKKFLSENREEIIKLKSFKNWKDNQIIDLFDDLLILGYKSAINPLSDDINCGYLKKPDKNYLQDPNLIDFKFNFVREILGRTDSQEESYGIIKKYIRFCENIVFNNKIIPSIKIINNKRSFPQAKKSLKKVRYFTIAGYPRHPKK